MANVTKEIIPPQNIEAEMAVLGSMMLEDKAVSIAIELLDRDYFYKDSHRKIFEAICNLYNNNKNSLIYSELCDTTDRI